MVGVIAERDAKWRYSAMKQMEKDVQRVISDLQNPKNCDSAKKLVCALNKGKSRIFYFLREYSIFGENILG